MLSRQRTARRGNGKRGPYPKRKSSRMRPQSPKKQKFSSLKASIRSSVMPWIRRLEMAKARQADKCVPTGGGPIAAGERVKERIRMLRKRFKFAPVSSTATRFQKMLCHQEVNLCSSNNKEGRRKNNFSFQGNGPARLPSLVFLFPECVVSDHNMLTIKYPNLDWNILNASVLIQPLALANHVIPL